MFGEALATHRQAGAPTGAELTLAWNQDQARGGPQSDAAPLLNS
jgi:hypothetical protein